MEEDKKIKCEEIPRAEDVLTDEELKQLEEDFLLDGRDGDPKKIPNWSVEYKRRHKTDK